MEIIRSIECSQCGVENEEGAVLCKNCGLKLSEGTKVKSVKEPVLPVQKMKRRYPLVVVAVIIIVILVGLFMLILR